MTRWKHLPIFLCALLCTAGCNLGTSPGGGTEGEGLSGLLQDPDGHLVAGALVRVFPEPKGSLGKSAGAAGAVFDSVYSDSHGRFRFDSLPDGEYGLRTYVKRGDTTFVLLMRGIPYDGKKKSLGTQTLVVGGKLSLQVRAATRAANSPNPPPPLQGAECSVVGLPYVSVADDSGRCVLDGLPPGQYAVRLSYPGFADVVTLPIEVRPGQTSGEGPWELPTPVSVRHYTATPGTLAHWTFDARDSVKGAFVYRDVSGNGKDLQEQGDVWRTVSPFGQAVAFGGTGGLSTAAPDSVLTGKAGRYLTLEARVRLTRHPANGGKDSSAIVMGARRGFSLAVRSNGALAVIAPGGDEATSLWQTYAAWSRPDMVPLHQWVDLAVSIDKQTLQAYGFIDGVPVQLFNRNSVLPVGATPQYAFQIARLDGTGRPFDGEIDEARVSDRLVLGAGISMGRADIDVDTVVTDTAGTGTVSMAAEADVTISSSVPGYPDVQDYGTRNRGKETVIGAATYDMSAASRVLVRFPNFNALVPSVRILSAKIVLTPNGWVPKNTRQSAYVIHVHRMLKSWKEGSAQGILPNSAAIDGATATERFWGQQNGQEDWSEVLVGLNDIDAASIPEATVSKASGTGTPWEFDVTALAKVWASDTTANRGVIFASPFPATNAEVWDYPQFHSRESSGAGPRLVLVVAPSNP